MSTLPTSTSLSPPLWKLILICSTAAFFLMLPANSIPEIAAYFNQTTITTEKVISWFLFGYGLGPLLYGPIANRFGRKKALYLGFIIGLLAMIATMVAVWQHAFIMLLISRFIAGIGTSVGIVVGTVMLKETVSHSQARYQFSFIVLFTAIAPSLSMIFSGMISQYLGLGFKSLFVLMFAILIVWLRIVASLQETHKGPNIPIEYKTIFLQYGRSFSELPFIYLVILTTSVGAVTIVFNGLAPLIAVGQMHITAILFSKLAIVPASGVILGTLLNAKWLSHLSAPKSIQFGLWLMLISVFIMSWAFLTQHISLAFLILPSFSLFLGVAIVLPNASIAAIGYASNAAIGAALLNTFVLISGGEVLNISSQFIDYGPAVLPITCCLLLSLSMILMKIWQKKHP